MKDIKHQLEIALVIKKKSMLGLSKEWGISHTHLRDVAKGVNKSKQTREKIIQFISDAKKSVPFSYPSKEQTKEQVEINHNDAIEAA